MRWALVCFMLFLCAEGSFAGVQTANSIPSIVTTSFIEISSAVPKLLATPTAEESKEMGQLGIKHASTMASIAETLGQVPVINHLMVGLAKAPHVFDGVINSKLAYQVTKMIDRVASPLGYRPFDVSEKKFINRMMDATAPANINEIDQSLSQLNSEMAGLIPSTGNPYMDKYVITWVSCVALFAICIILFVILMIFSAVRGSIQLYRSSKNKGKATAATTTEHQTAWHLWGLYLLPELFFSLLCATLLTGLVIGVGMAVKAVTELQLSEKINNITVIISSLVADIMKSLGEFKEAAGGIIQILKQVKPDELVKTIVLIQQQAGRMQELMTKLEAFSASMSMMPGGGMGMGAAGIGSAAAAAAAAGAGAGSGAGAAAAAAAAGAATTGATGSGAGAAAVAAGAAGAAGAGAAGAGAAGSSGAASSSSSSSSTASVAAGATAGAAAGITGTAASKITPLFNSQMPMMMGGNNMLSGALSSVNVPSRVIVAAANQQYKQHQQQQGMVGTPQMMPFSVQQQAEDPLKFYRMFTDQLRKAKSQATQL